MFSFWIRLVKNNTERFHNISVKLTSHGHISLGASEIFSWENDATELTCRKLGHLLRLMASAAAVRTSV